MNKLSCLFVMVMLVSGCATTISQMTAPNRENLLKLSLGMTKNEAISIMGTKKQIVHPNPGPAYIFMPGAVINNPYRSEILQGKDKTFEVIYYATDDKNNDGAISDDELTPLVFDNGKLIGWGQSFLQDNVQKYEIRMR
jgi:hypothetical protein